MKAGQLIQWFRSAEPGDRTVYWSKGHALDEPPPPIFAIASQLGEEGAFLYQRHGQYGIMKLSHRARRFVSIVGRYPDLFRHYRSV